MIRESNEQAVVEGAATVSVERWRRLAIWIAGAAVAVVLVVVAARYYAWSRRHESTDDAFVDCHVVRVAPRVAGRARRVLVDDNQNVRAGDLLLEIDPADLRTALDRAHAARAQTQGRLAEAHAQLLVAEATEAQAGADIVAARAQADNAATDLARYRATRTGAVSRQSVDAAATAATRSSAEVLVREKAKAAATAQIALARAQILSAEADLGDAEAAVAYAALQLSYTEVHAAEAGRVTLKSVTAGDYVQVGQQLFALVPDRVWVTANFKETQVRRLRPGQPVTIHIDAYARDFRGRVDSIQAGSGAAFSLLPPENATGNYVKVVQRVPVKIVFDEPTDEVLLGPGMSVEPTVTVE